MIIIAALSVYDFIPVADALSNPLVWIGAGMFVLVVWGFRG